MRAPDFITCRSFLSLLFPALFIYLFFLVALQQVVIFLGFVLLPSSGLVPPTPAYSQEISDVPNQSEAN